MTEFSLSSFEKTIDLMRLGDVPVDVSLAISPGDGVRLAQDLGIPGVESLKGKGVVTRRGSLVTVTGTISARLVRQCVVSLESMTEDVGDRFEVIYTTKPAPTDASLESEADLDAPEPVADGLLEMGAVFIEQLVLAMTPHPRLEGALPVEDPGAGARISPFDALKALKNDE